MGLPFACRVLVQFFELYGFSAALEFLPLGVVSLTEHFVQEEIDLLLLLFATDLIA